MRTLALVAALLTVIPFAQAQRNERPPRPRGPARTIVAPCEIAVRFNDDERSVPESDYLDGMYCFGLMEGALSVGGYVRANDPDHALFCIPEPGIKTWRAAQVIVNYAHANPDRLDRPIDVFIVEALENTFPCWEGDKALPTPPPFEGPLPGT